MKIHLVAIDPQNDFCRPDGALSVPGASADMDRLALLVHRLNAAASASALSGSASARRARAVLA